MKFIKKLIKNTTNTVFSMSLTTFLFKKSIKNKENRAFCTS